MRYLLFNYLKRKFCKMILLEIIPNLVNNYDKRLCISFAICYGLCSVKPIEY